MNSVTRTETAAVTEASPVNQPAAEISLAYLQLAFERTYKGPVGLAPNAPEEQRHLQFSKRKNGTYQSDRLQNIFQGFCLAMQSINDSSIAFSDLKNGK
jgi:hypothetical protein